MRMFISYLLLIFLLIEVESLYYCRKALLNKNFVYTDNFEIKWFSQKLNHEDQENTKYWNQRYFASSIFWKGKENGPVFLLLTGEYEASPIVMESGFWVTLAQKFGALMFTLEHRFYGQSHPTKDTSLESLKHLSIKSVIGDVSYFIRSMRQEYDLTTTNKWIIFGGGYAGNLAAWSSVQLGKLIYGGVVSSAPLKSELDFLEYQENIRIILASKDEECPGNLIKAVSEIRKKFSSPTGTQEIMQKFNVCTSGIDGGNPNDQSLFFQNLFAPIHKAVEYDEDRAYIEEASIVCEYMAKTSIPSALDRLANLWNYYNYLKRIRNDDTAGCLEGNFQATLKSYKATEWNDTFVKNGKRQWLYQSCTELGDFQTSTSDQSILHNVLPLKYFVKLCMEVFGNQFHEAETKRGIDKTTKTYKGLNIKPKYVIFVRNDRDPWYSLCLDKRPSKFSPFYEVEDGNHCNDMKKPVNNVDGKYMINARAKIISTMESWKLNQKYD